MNVVLSIFPGIDLLGMAFEENGYCVLRGPDKLFGGDIRRFSVPSGLADGVIGGPPCQEFSAARNGHPASGYGLEMLGEFMRVVAEAQPVWWLMENVPRVPDVRFEGYSWQRLDVWAHEYGLKQRRLRHFQFGSRDDTMIVLPRGRSGGSEPTVTASDSNGTSWEKYVALQGLPTGFELPVFSQLGRKKVVGNGVPLPVGRAFAKAIKQRVAVDSVRVCGCGCGRPVFGKALYANGACRFRVYDRRKRDADSVQRRVLTWANGRLQPLVGSAC